MTVGCRKGNEGTDEWFVVSEDTHLYHVVDTQWKGKGRMEDIARVKATSTVPLKRPRVDPYSSLSGSPLLSNSPSLSGIPSPTLFRPSTASLSQAHYAKPERSLSSSLMSKVQAKTNLPSNSTALPTSTFVSSKDLTAFLYSLSPILTPFESLLRHRGVDSFDSLLSLLQKDKSILSTFYSSLGSLSDLEKSTGLKEMPVFLAVTLSSKLTKLAEGDRAEKRCGVLD